MIVKAKSVRSVFWFHSDKTCNCDWTWHMVWMSPRASRGKQPSMYQQRICFHHHRNNSLDFQCAGLQKGFPSCYTPRFWKISDIIHDQGSRETWPSAQSYHSPAHAEPLPLNLLQDNWILLLKCPLKKLPVSSVFHAYRLQKTTVLSARKRTPPSISRKEMRTSLRGLSKQAGSAHLYSPLASNGKAPAEEARHPQDCGQGHQLCSSAFTCRNRS